MLDNKKSVAINHTFFLYLVINQINLFAEFGFHSIDCVFQDLSNSFGSKTKHFTNLESVEWAFLSIKSVIEFDDFDFPNTQASHQ